MGLFWCIQRIKIVSSARFFIINIHTKTLSHLHSGYRPFCAGCLGAVQTDWSCLAKPKRPWMQMQRSSLVRRIVIRAYCQLYYCVLNYPNSFKKSFPGPVVCFHFLHHWSHCRLNDRPRCALAFFPSMDCKRSIHPRTSLKIWAKLWPNMRRWPWKKAVQTRRLSKLSCPILLLMQNFLNLGAV